MENPMNPHVRSRAPRFWAGILALTALVVIPLQGAAQDVGLPLGTRAPNADVETLEGQPMRLLDVVAPGKPALLEFWAVWCGECDILQPQLDRIHARYGDRLSMVAIAVGVAQTRRRVNQHIASHDPGYPFVWDARGAAVRAYEATTTSTVVLLDAEGRVVYTGVGGSQNLEAALAQLLPTN
jgi:thiol-disulfide isomerase/thioredoxin